MDNENPLRKGSDELRRFFFRLFPASQPFGPASAEFFDPTDTMELDAVRIVFSEHGDLAARLALRPSVLFGRRGSGKSFALMNSLYPRDNVKAGTPQQPYDIIVYKSQQSQWRFVEAAAQTRFYADNKDPSVEEMTELWRRFRFSALH
jgi:hypothetical protein